MIPQKKNFVEQLKSKNWSYEEEYRIISKSNESFFHFDQSELTGIIIGNRSLCAQELVSWATKGNIPIYYTFTSTQNYEINIINKSPNTLIIGDDTLDNIPHH